MEFFTENGTKTALKKLKRLKKAQGSRKSRDLTEDLGCLFEAGYIWLLLRLKTFGFDLSFAEAT